MSSKSIQSLQKKFEQNKESYTKIELGTGTQGFVREYFETIIELKGKTTYESFHRNFFVQETQKNTKSEVRADFILNINGIKVVVEVEKRNNIKPGIEQIERYMREEGTPYGILTDTENWYFYNKGFDKIAGEFGGGIYKNLAEILSENGKGFFEAFFNTKEYYINFFNRIDIESFFFTPETLQKDIKHFHRELIQVAEKLKSDFEKSQIFGDVSNKELTQTTYSFIIQLLLIKIIQDKKNNLNLISKENFVHLLQNNDFNGLANSIFSQIDWLGKFYTSYQNEQKHLIEKISKHYQSGVFGLQLDFDAVQGFLDLYIFVYKFNFKNIKQDIFGAVYENYLKEIYKDDNTKKGQVFTPPDIVDFMLDEIGYTKEYVQKILKDYVKEVGYPQFREELIKNESEVNFNIPGLSIIDPACGSGTFLYKAAGRIINGIHGLLREVHELINDDNKKLPGILSENLIINNIVGFDIEAFPLYLAEMNILQALLWYNIDEQTGEILNPINKTIKIFSTEDSIREFSNMGENIGDILGDFDRQGIFAINTKRVPHDIAELKVDILNGDIDMLLQKYLVSHYANHLYISDEKIKKKFYKFTTLSDLEKYIDEEGDEFLKISYYGKPDYTGTSDLQKLGLKRSSAHMINNFMQLLTKHRTKRTKFDFVIANPPYVRQLAIYDNDNLFGININLKKYSKIYLDNDGEIRVGNSKFNIYGYFYYLAYFLLKEEGKLCFINPRTLLFQPSFHKLRQFLKYNTKLLKIYDFSNAILFYERGLNQKIEVITDACITLLQKHKQNNDIKENYYERINYTGKDKLLNLLLFKENNSGILKQKISDVFDYSGYRFYHYFTKLQEKSEDFHISIYPRIDKKLLNNDSIGIPFLQPEGYYSNSYTEYYSYDINGVLETYPTCDLIRDKKFKISWSSITQLWSMAKKMENGIKFTFTDFIWTNKWDTFTSIGVNNEDNISEIYFMFSFLNSSTNQENIKTLFSGNINKTNLWLLPFPKINSPIKQSIKEKLIKNGEEIIALSKNGEQRKLTYRDIVETQIVGMDEEIVGLKNEYKNIPVDLRAIHLDDEVPADISGESAHKSLSMLERERDLLVYCLYFGSDSGEEKMIDLGNINLGNIFASEDMICKNENVQVIEK